MAPSRNSDRQARESRERLRRYRARQAVYTQQGRRRRRDNIVGIAGILVVATLATLTQVAYFTAGPGMPAPSASASPSPDADGQNTGDVPSADIAESRTWTGVLELNDVPLGIEIDGAAAPQAASVFISLQQSGYYTNNVCHRLTTSETLRVIQCGQPDGVNSVDPGFQFGPVENAPADGIYPAGTIAMARADTQYTNSTQFFVVYADTTLPTDGGGYTVFGRVTSGLDRFVSEIASAGVAPADDGTVSTDGTPAIPVSITSLTLE